MKWFVCLSSICWMLFFMGCGRPQSKDCVQSSSLQVPDTLLPLPELPEPQEKKLLRAADIQLVKELLYDKYTLEDVYPYKDTVRSFKWERNCLNNIINVIFSLIR